MASFLPSKRSLHLVSERTVILRDDQVFPGPVPYMCAQAYQIICLKQLILTNRAKGIGGATLMLPVMNAPVMNALQRHGLSFRF